MSLWKSIKGWVVVQLTSADVAGALIAITESGIPIGKAESVDAMTLRLTVSREYLAKLKQLAAKRGEELTVLSRRGLYWTSAALAKRPILLAAILLLMAAAVYLPTRVLFVQVEGNETIPSRRILEAAESCGIRFGASRREVRSEKVKNALLGAVPQLQWAGVNTAGCVATISVRERADTEEPVLSGEVSSIVAARDGRILSCTATAGSLQCTPGQAVREGQVLISGYTDCGLVIQATRAEGEVMAHTRRELTAVTPSQALWRVESGEKSKSYSLILGKKRINFWKDSRICDATCGRMYEEYYITLPGGFQLPAALAVETHFCRETDSAALPQEKAESALTEFVRNYLGQQMISGTILEEDLSFYEQEGVYRLDGDFLCREMIGTKRQEGKGNTNGKSD